MSATPPPAGATDASGPSDPAGDRPPPSEGPAPPGLGLTDLGGPPDTTSGPGDMLARMMGTLGPMLAALQLGSVVGHLARTTLGPYELPIPRPSARLLVVPANVTRFAEEWSLAPDEVRLWVCVREETIQAVLTRPHVAGRLRELLVDVVRGMAEDAAGVVDQMKGLDPSDPGALERLLDPAALLGAEPTPARQRAAADLMAVTAALLGYVEHVLDQAAARLLGGRSAISEAWRRRQVGRESSDLAAEAMFGLDLGPAQIDRGSEFVHGVLERGGDEGLARLWSAAHTLPTPAEVDAPGLWLERIDLAES